MKLIIHIGQPKTGTTSIQAALMNNKKILLESSILYYTDNNNGHFRYLHALGGKTRSPQKKHLNIQSEVYKEIDEMQILAKKQNVKYILLSAESFFPLDFEKQKLLIDLFKLKFTSISIIAYIRNPVDNYFSGMQQMIKGSHRYISPIEYKNNSLIYLKRWSEFVGRENMFIKPFDKNTLIENNIVVDFIKLLEKITKNSLPAFIYSKDEKNVSLSAEQMIVLQKYRNDFLLDDDGFFHPNSDKLISFFNNIQELDCIFLTKAKLKLDLKPIINKNNKESIEKIDKYFDTHLASIFYKDDFDNIQSHKEEEYAYINIVDIIQTYDQKTLDFLLKLIPDYNKSIKLSSKELPSHRSLQNPYFLMYYSKYLISIGIIDTSIDLLKRSYKQAKNKKLNDSNFYYEISYLLMNMLNHTYNKLNEYTKIPVLSESEIKLKKMINTGEIAIIPIGFRCYTKMKVFEALNFKQEALPFDSGFFPPSSVASIIRNPIINLTYPDNNLTHSVCIKYENYNDSILGSGIKFQKSTYSEINSFVEKVDIKNINRYLDSTYAYYTLDLQHNFVLAHYNWTELADVKKSKGITDPEINIQNINNILNKRIERMFSMCNSAKYIFFIFDEEQGYEYMMIDEQHFDLHDLKDVETVVNDTFSAQSFVTTFTKTNSADKILKMLKEIKK